MQDFNDWALVSLSPLPFAWRVIGVIAVVAAAGLVVWSYRGARRRISLSIWRILAGILVVGFLIEPALQLRAVRKIPSRLAVVVDRSRSMSLASESGQSRYDQVLRLIADNRLELQGIEEDYLVDWYDLDGPLASGKLETPPTGESSDLLSGLEKAREEGGGRPLAGLVLISDGADNADLEAQTLSSETIERLKRLGAPVSTINVVDADAFRDASVVEVLADEFAFVHNTIEIEAIVEAVGIGSRKVPVTLKREGAVIDTQEITLESGRPKKVIFKTKPDQIGEFVYEVSIPRLTGEAVTSNNLRSFVLQVIRDKIRVLQVAGRPSWDERFLRQHLKENPNVDLISFFILRTPTDLPVAGDEDLSLIPFPTDQLFTTELESFDVIIFQNFDYRPYDMVQYLPNIAQAVRGGLGFVMLGGDQSFGSGGYLGTVLEDVVPVRTDAVGLVEERLQPRLTEAGRRHPITSLSPGGSNDNLWAELPAWSSYNKSGGLMPNATSLVAHPTSRGADGKQLPLVAVAEIDEGRAMAIATDSVWRWRFSSARDGGLGQRAYHRFWSNALRWLVRDPETSRVQVRPERRRFDLDDPAEVVFSVQGRDYRPIPFAALRLTLEHATADTQVIEDVTTGESGVLRRRFDDLEPGAYRITAEARSGDEALGRGAGVFLVAEESAELSRGAPRPELLKALAENTGGVALSAPSDPWEQVTKIDPDVVEIDRRRNVELWDNGWALALGLLLLALDWSTRRRSGYL